MARTLYSFSPLSAVPTNGTFPELLEFHATERRKGLAYDAAAIEVAAFDFIAPVGITTPISAVLKFVMASATSGNVVMSGTLECITDGDTTDLDAAVSYDTANVSAATAVPATAGIMKELSITLTNNDAIAAGDKCRIKIQRDATNGSDTAAGDLYLTDVELRDSA